MIMKEGSSSSHLVDSKPPSGVMRLFLEAKSFVCRSVCSVQTFLTFLFLLFFVTLGICVILVFHFLSSTNIENVHNRHQSALLSLIGHETENWLNQGHRLINTSLDWMHMKEDAGEIHPDFRWDATDKDREMIDKMLYFITPEIKNVHAMSGLLVGGHLGNEWGALNAPHLPFIVEVWTNETTHDNPCCTYTAEDLKEGVMDGLPGPISISAVSKSTASEIFPWKVATTSSNKHHDYRLGQWYMAIDPDSPEDEFVWLVEEEPPKPISLNLVRKYLDRNGTFRGVVRAWYLVAYIQEFLETFTNETGMVFLVLQKPNEPPEALRELLLGSSKFDPFANTSEFRHPYEISSTTLRDASRHIAKLNGGLSAVKDVTSERFQSGKKELIVSSKAVEVLGGLNILAVHVVEHNVLFSEVIIAQYATIFISIALVLVASFSSCFCVFVAMRPLNRLGKQMKLVETMELAKIKFGKSIFSEVRSIQERFKVCVDKLTEYRCFLPACVIDKEEYDVESDDDSVSASHSTFSKTSSNSSDSSTSSDSSKSSSNSHQTSESSDDRMSTIFMRTGFALGLQMIRYVIVCVRIVNWRELMMQRRDFIELFEQFMGFVVSAKTFGKVLQFDPGKIVLHFRESRLHWAVGMVYRLQNSLKFDGLFKDFKVVISCVLSECMSGVVGTKEYKSRIMVGGSVDRAVFVSSCADAKQECGVYIDQAVYRGISSVSGVNRASGVNSTYILLPYFVVFSPTAREWVHVFKLVPYHHHEDGEWMYKLANENIRKCEAVLKSGYEMLLINTENTGSDLAEELKKKLSEVGEGDFIKQVVNEVKRSKNFLRSIAEKMGEVKVGKFIDYLRSLEQEEVEKSDALMCPFQCEPPKQEEVLIEV